MPNAPDPDDPLLQFVNSMPAAYRHAFDRRAIEEHARIVERGSRQRGHAEVWQVQPRGLAVVCVVAPDLPGLLSVITSVFVLHRLAVTSAHVFSRLRSDGQVEAVDLFWVRRANRVSAFPPSPELLDRCVSTIRTYLCERIDPAELAYGMSLSRFGTSLRMRWEAGTGGAATLWLETTDFPGLLMAVAQALYDSRVTVVRSDIQTRGSRALDRFDLLTWDLRPLDAEDRANVQVRIGLALREWRGRVELRRVG
jgi:UTP:GlnB (protein PII) uridylyltransferase